MKRFGKAGILIMTLVVPALIFLFLKFFGQNHFVLPRYIPMIDSATNEPIMKKVLKPKYGQPELDTLFRTIPNFSFIDQNNKVFNQEKTKNKIYVANFIFTRCGLICPKVTNQLARVQDAFLDKDDVLFVSHTVDPQYDTPEILKKYAIKNDAIDGKWYFVTGDKGELYKMALKGYFIPVSDASVYNKAITNPDEAFIHSEKMILVDKEGVIRGFYDGTDSKEIDRLMVEIKILRDIYSKNDSK
jgi:protein SCO1/2